MRGPRSISPSTPSCPRRADGSRTSTVHRDLEITRNGEQEHLRENIMMHTGGGGTDVGTWSMGCQTPQGSWYPNYMENLRRELGRRQQRDLTYTLIDGQTLD